MMMQVVVNSSGDVVGTVAISPDSTEAKGGVVGVAALPGQTIYVVDVPDADSNNDVLEFHAKCQQAIDGGSARLL